MSAAEELYERLKSKYGGRIPFREICEDEGIVALKAPLADGCNGLYIAVNGTRLIVLNANISKSERRTWAFHELSHHFLSPHLSPADRYGNRREEARASLFAALCRAPIVRDGDTPELLAERYDVPLSIAKIRIEYEIRRSIR